MPQAIGPSHPQRHDHSKSADGTALAPATLTIPSGTAGTNLSTVPNHDHTGDAGDGGAIAYASLTGEEPVFTWKDDPPTVKTLTALEDENTWTAVDVTSDSSATATRALLKVNMDESVDRYLLYLRRTGSSEAVSVGNRYGDVAPGHTICNNLAIVPLDAGQTFEYLLDRFSGVAALDLGTISLLGYWAPAT